MEGEKDWRKNSEKRQFMSVKCYGLQRTGKDEKLFCNGNSEVNGIFSVFPFNA